MLADAHQSAKRPLTLKEVKAAYPYETLGTHIWRLVLPRETVLPTEERTGVVGKRMEWEGEG